MKKNAIYAYFYDNQNKTEAFCSITRKRNWGMPGSDAEKTVQEVLPIYIEDYHILEVEKRVPFGSLLSDILSVDFTEAERYFRATRSDEQLKEEYSQKLFPAEEPLLSVWGGTKADIGRLYFIRQYIEMCIEYPRLYSFGQFELLLSTIYDRDEAWHLKTLGFFAPIESTDAGRYFFDDKRAFQKAEYCIRGDGLSDMEHIFRVQRRDYILPSPVVEVFRISNVVDAVLLSLFHLLQEQTAIKKCANCQKFFVPLARGDAIYCDRPAPQDSKKTCKEYGSKVLWYETIVNDDVAKLARNIYCAKQMLAKRNPDKPEFAEMFEYFKAEKKKWEQEVKAGRKTREEFVEWLRAMKLRRTLSEPDKS